MSFSPYWDTRRMTRPVQLPGDPVHSTSRPTAFSPPAQVVLDDSESVDFPQLSPSGRTVAGTSRSDQVCHIWRMVDRVAITPEYEVHHLTYRCMEPDFAPSCASLVDDDQLVVAFRDGTIRWWDISVFPLATTEPRGVLTLHPGDSDSDSAEVTSLSVSPHHSFLVAYSHQVPTVWVLRRGENSGLGASQSGLSNVKLSLHASLQGRTGPIWAACFSPCERYVATASWNTVRLWSVGDGSLVWTFEDHDARVSHLVFTPDGKSLVLADEDGRVCVHALCMFVRDAPLCLE
ncbi:WD40-repeat-containing domain protein [Cerioporus squamosus]|nr:WD40-repeat-containing domain protein [Cerioporus squamosus]